MNFLKNLFGKKDKATIEPMRGGAVMQTQAEQDATRERMESEMAGQRTIRDEASKEQAAEKPSQDSR
jgi:hypothetical protein